ncbi:DUF4435 domain-containing protein [Streptomyces collinus]|uniref:DUF4435 domain-containing protein n=1 Tax=Streptomyces collinus TaxID=42684 RepID=UPI00130D68FB|nr:DUF4435 domain-containing protein [Streptomyces collinus]UJA08800.1 hypothetical protein HGI10_27260 [Streptomyces collinus]UJA16336.1 hypothetical protein HGI09_36860 [Streptomyces collinus]
MLQNLTGDDLFSYLILLGAGSSDRRYLICEGDSDCAVLDPHLQEDACETVPGYGKDSVVVAISLVEQQGLRNVGALVDRDWNKSRHSISSLAARTDFYDIDATVFFSGTVCRRIVSAFCDREKVREFLSIHKLASPADAAVRLALPLGVLRKLSYDHGWGLRVAGTPIKEVVRESGDAVDTNQLFDLCLKRSKKARISQNDKAHVLALFETEMASVANSSEYCCGHDLNSVLAYLMQAHWGGRVSKDMLERAMRGALSCAELASTRLYGQIHSVLRSPEGSLFNCGTTRINHPGVPQARAAAEDHLGEVP